jgi:hypothetical protein
MEGRLASAGVPGFGLVGSMDGLARGLQGVGEETKEVSIEEDLVVLKSFRGAWG